MHLFMVMQTRIWRQAEERFVTFKASEYYKMMQFAAKSRFFFYPFFVFLHLFFFFFTHNADILRECNFGQIVL